VGGHSADVPHARSGLMLMHVRSALMYSRSRDSLSVCPSDAGVVHLVGAVSMTRCHVKTAHQSRERAIGLSIDDGIFRSLGWNRRADKVWHRS